MRDEGVPIVHACENRYKHRDHREPITEYLPSFIHFLIDSLFHTQ
jgi:hypothetical protein